MYMSRKSSGDQSPDWSKMNVAFGKKERRGRVTGGHLVNTREYAIAWGVKHRPYTRDQLIELCKEPGSPSFTFLVRKCWRGFTRYYNALVDAGMPPRPPRTEEERRRAVAEAAEGGLRGLVQEDYDLARMAAEYGVVTMADYNRIRQSNEDARRLLPCVQTVMKRYGSWSRFAYEVKKYNVDMVITEYVRKSAECGHWLRLSECDRMKIPIRGIMDVLRSRVFNTLCYRKLAAMGLVSNIGEYSGDANAGRTGRGGRKDEK